MKSFFAVIALFLFALAACAVGNGDPPIFTPEPVTPPAASGVAPAASGAEQPRATDAGSPEERDAATADGGSDASSDAADASLAVPVADASAACADYAEPALLASCHACGSKPCQMNGCYNGYWCNTGIGKCQPKPAACP